LNAAGQLTTDWLADGTNGSNASGVNAITLAAVGATLLAYIINNGDFVYAKTVTKR
jgi:hypothetical protein